MSLSPRRTRLAQRFRERRLPFDPARKDAPVQAGHPSAPVLPACMGAANPDAADLDLAGVEAALLSLRALQPRPGLEARTVARLASAHPLPRRGWTTLLPAAPLGAAGTVAAAALIALAVHLHHPTAPSAPALRAHLPVRVIGGVNAAAAVAVPLTAIHPTLRGRNHRVHAGLHYGRATHTRAPLPNGTIAPTHLRPPRLHQLTQP